LRGTFVTQVGTDLPVIKMTLHASRRALERGTTAEEIEEVLQTGVPFQAESGRQGKAKVFKFEKQRHGRYYNQKRVEVIYVEEDDTLVVVTVYVFFGNWR